MQRRGPASISRTSKLQRPLLAPPTSHLQPLSATSQRVRACGSTRKARSSSNTRSYSTASSASRKYPSRRRQQWVQLLRLHHLETHAAPMQQLQHPAQANPTAPLPTSTKSLNLPLLQPSGRRYTLQGRERPIAPVVRRRSGEPVWCICPQVDGPRLLLPSSRCLPRRTRCSPRWRVERQSRLEGNQASLLPGDRHRRRVVQGDTLTCSSDQVTGSSYETSQDKHNQHVTRSRWGSTACT